MVASVGSGDLNDGSDERDVASLWHDPDAQV